MRIYIFEEDSSLLKLLTLHLENQGHSVQGFLSNYDCPLFLLNECQCPSNKPCADAVIVNARVPTEESLQVFIDQDLKGCKLPKKNKAVMSANFNAGQEDYFKQQGFSIIKKPFRLTALTTWLRECALRLEGFGS